jgi:hypothetical protein
LATETLAAERLECQLYRTEHGSDHIAITTTFALQVAPTSSERRRVFKNADWKRIRTTVDSLGDPPQEIADNEVETYETYLTEAVEKAIDKHVPVAKPSPYARRWWTQDLTHLRKEYTYWRNRARATRRAGQIEPLQTSRRLNRLSKRICNSDGGGQSWWMDLLMII